MRQRTRTKWLGLLCAGAAFPAVTQAQVTAQAAAPAAAPASAPTTANPPRVDVVAPALLPGIGVRRNQLPYTVEQLGPGAINSENAVSLPELMGQRLPSVNVNEIQGNPYQPDVNFRGYTASPLLGTPQGLSVYLDGVRINEPFGDVVNWDLIPHGSHRQHGPGARLEPAVRPEYARRSARAAYEERRQPPWGRSRGLRRLVRPRQRPVRGYGRRFDDGMHFFAAGTWFERERLARLFALECQPAVRQGRPAHGDYEWTLASRRRTPISSATALSRSRSTDQRRAASSPARTARATNSACRLSTAAITSAGQRLAICQPPLYYRDVNTRTLNGDVNDDFEDGSKSCEADVPTAVGQPGQHARSRVPGGAAMEPRATINHRPRRKR